MQRSGRRGLGWTALTVLVVLVEIAVVIKAIAWLFGDGKLAALTLAPIAFAFYAWIGVNTWRRSSDD